MSDPTRPPGQPDRRQAASRRGFFRGGRRRTDWPATLTMPITCPRCGSPEAKFVDGTPDTLFWTCHGCRQAWSTSPDGRVLE